MTTGIQQHIRQLPHSQEAEEAILGAILINNKIIYEIMEIINEDDFYFPQCKKIYKHIVNLCTEGTSVDVLTLQESLKRTKELEAVGGPVYIDHLYDQVPASENARHYAYIIKENKLRRDLIRLGEELKDIGYNCQESEIEIRDKVGQRFIELTREEKSRGYRTLPSLVDSIYEYINPENKEKRFSGLRTGYENLDAILGGGFQKSNLIILAARPAVGKTTLALNIAENVARNGGSVLFFSLEMSAIELALRILSSISGINSQLIRKGEIPDSKKKNDILHALQDMDNMKITIVDKSHVTPFQIRMISRQVAFENQGELDLIVVDYLQLLNMPSSQKYDGRVQEVSQISRSLKSLARELDVPLLAISQLSRESEKQRRAPKLSDLRESGSLEQDADVVMFIHRKESDEISIDGTTDATLEIAKQRNGPTGKIKMKFHKARTRFYAAPETKEAGFEDEEESMENY